ncbi:Cinnamoyl-CoA:phenyllactate CoA-transferase [Paraburkholderia ultramafica]|uniref:Cinnamoyl-CoA:phenyllactate CoA-transferase n=1 Tax=Paraburkholderia ultramafica TaxID=1544867 RepID=A0A6S7BQN8_9BURK|nr:CoA transferase [Paraburkholderia ultramafica]CAB3809258.1 Cinnamoyl-CoA:phenyllactate CoA-transferase [Paraburkholderia ultramafica]
MTAGNHIFSGLKVLDLASYIAGPAAATILADFGADVIKVEPPGTGDVYRYFSAMPPNPTSDVNYAWQLTNRNKRSIAIDLKSADAKEVLHRLVRWADVVVVNFPPRVKSSLGCTYEALAPLNEKLIYADITGYGSEGPEADTPGFDVTAYWARSGLMEVTHDAGSPPTLPIPGIGDHATATTLYAAIVTALYVRATTGKGSHVSTSLIANGIWAAAAWVEGGLNGGHFFPQHDRKSPPNALLNPYQTLDKRWILLVAAQRKDWPGFCKAIGKSELLDDPRFIDDKRTANAAQLVEILDPMFASQPLAYWKQVLDAGRVIFGVVQIATEIINDPQLSANGIVVPLELSGGIQTRTVSSPIQVLGSPKVKPEAAPQLGEHGAQILKELGFDDAEIARLNDVGAVARFKDAS